MEVSGEEFQRVAPGFLAWASGWRLEPVHQWKMYSFGRKTPCVQLLDMLGFVLFPVGDV